MPEPITAIAVSLNIACGLAANAVQAGGVSGLKTFVSILARGTKSENNDILKATHAAYVASMEVMAAAAHQTAFSAEECKAAAKFGKLVGSKPFRKFRDNGEHFPLDAANAAIDRLFSHGLAHATGATGETVLDPFAEIALADLESWQVPVPDLLRTLFLEGLASFSPWNTVFRDNFSKLVKTNTADFRILTFERLGELRQMGLELAIGVSARFDDLDKSVNEIKVLLSEHPKHTSKISATSSRTSERTGKARIPQGLTMLLEELSVRPADFTTSSQYPPAINRAIQLYTQNWAELAPATRTHDVVVRVSDYPSLLYDHLEAAHAEFRELLTGLQKRLPELGTLQSRNTQYVGAFLEDIGLPVRRKVLVASSFYYHSSSRRQAWGVIPLGLHRAFGLVVDRATLRHIIGGDLATLEAGNAEPDYISANLSRLRQRVRDTTALYGWNWSAREAAAVVRRIVRYVSATNGRILYRRGYVQHDMLHDLVAGFKEPDLIGQLQDALTADPGEDESDFALFRRRAACSASGDEAVVAAFDLGQIDRIATGIRRVTTGDGDEHVIIVVRRDPGDTIGLGFSLPLLPLLLRSGEWAGNPPAELLYRWLARSAVETYLDRPSAQTREKFMMIGLDLRNGQTG